MSSGMAKLAFDPSMLVGRVLLTVFTGYVVFVPIIQIVLILRDLTAGQVKEMIFTDVTSVVGWSVLVLGVLLSTFVATWYRYWDTAKHKGQEPFNINYAISVVVTLIFGALIGGIIAFDAMPCLWTNVELPLHSSILAILVIGAFSAFFVNILVFDPLANGTVGRNIVKMDAIAKKLLESEEAREAVFQAVAKKCKDAGLLDEEAIKKIASIVGSSEDSMVPDLIEYYLGKQKEAAKQ